MIPSFTALWFILIGKNYTIASVKFKPIISRPPNDYDKIIITMINFQDVLKQKGFMNGALWSDKSVYQLTKTF